MQSLSAQEIERYSRHIMLDNFGMEAQLRLKSSKVLCIGSGGLGSPALQYLAAAGVGTLGVVDFDSVELSNLQRQIIHGSADIGKAKVDSALAGIQDINPHVKVETHNEPLTSQNALKIIQDYDLVLDTSDNYPTRFLVNDACHFLSKAFVSGSVFHFEGQLSFFHSQTGPCYRCLYTEPPPPGVVPSCAEGGVLGAVPGTIGCMQALTAIQFLAGLEVELKGKLRYIDFLSGQFKTLAVRKNPKCVLCSPDSTQKELIDYQQFCGISKAEDSEKENTVSEISVEELKTHFSEYVLVDVRSEQERKISKIEGGVHIPLNQIEDAAKSAFAKKDQKIACHCKSGVRSQKAALQLEALGFQNVFSLKGGILEWQRVIDPSLAKY